MQGGGIVNGGNLILTTTLLYNNTPDARYNNVLGQQGIKAFTAVLPLMPNLKELNFSGVLSGDVLAFSLAEAAQQGHLQSMETISLAKTQTADPGLGSLAQALKDLPSLKNLSLQSNPGITDRGCESLAIGCKNYAPDIEVVLFNTRAGRAGIEKLTAALRNEQRNLK